MSGKPCRTQEVQAQYVGFNIPPYCHIEMGCKSCLQHLMRFKPFLHFSFSCSSIRTDCHFIFAFFGFPFHSCFGLMFIPFKYMQHSLQFLCIQTLLKNQTKWVEGKTFFHRSTCTVLTRGPMTIIIKGWPLFWTKPLDFVLYGVHYEGFLPFLSNGFRDSPILRLNRKAGDKEAGISPIVMSWKMLLII